MRTAEVGGRTRQQRRHGVGRALPLPLRRSRRRSPAGGVLLGAACGACLAVGGLLALLQPTYGLLSASVSLGSAGFAATGGCGTGDTAPTVPGAVYAAVYGGTVPGSVYGGTVGGAVYGPLGLCPLLTVGEAVYGWEGGGAANRWTVTGSVYAGNRPPRAPG